MDFTIFHFLVCILLAVVFLIICVLIFLKAKNIQTAIAFYIINIVFTSIIIYSLLLSVEQYTKQAQLSDLTFARNLRTESLTISGKITNKTKFKINKCFLQLTISDKKGSSDNIFKPGANTKSQNTSPSSISHTIQIISLLPGHSYKEFSVQIPYPQSFVSAEFYHTLNCI